MTDDKRNQLAEHLAAEAKRDLLHVLSTPRGRAFIWRIMAMAGINQQSFTGEPLSTAFNEGRRAVGNEILAELNEHAPEAFIVMLREQQRSALQAKAAASEAREESEADG